MNELEFVVTERNRLTRLSIVVTIISFALATWARDPGLNITTPFSGSEAGNLTVGHAVLIGHPVLCVIYFVLVAQIFRYKSIVQILTGRERDHLDWKLRRGKSGNNWFDAIHNIYESFRWFAMAAIPAIACGFLLDAQTEFRNIELEKKYSYSYMMDIHSFHEFYNIKPSYLSLHREECEEYSNEDKKSTCKRKQMILERMPTLYQPYNFIFGLILQVFVAIALVVTAIRYFAKEDPWSR